MNIQMHKNDSHLLSLSLSVQYKLVHQVCSIYIFADILISYPVLFKLETVVIGSPIVEAYARIVIFPSVTVFTFFHLLCDPDQRCATDQSEVIFILAHLVRLLHSCIHCDKKSGEKKICSLSSLWTISISITNW